MCCPILSIPSSGKDNCSSQGSKAIHSTTFWILDHNTRRAKPSYWRTRISSSALLSPELFAYSTNISTTLYRESMSTVLPACSDQHGLKCTLVLFYSFGYQVKCGGRSWLMSCCSGSGGVCSTLFLMAEEAFWHHTLYRCQEYGKTFWNLQGLCWHWWMAFDSPVVYISSRRSNALVVAREWKALVYLAGELKYINKCCCSVFILLILSDD